MGTVGGPSEYLSETDEVEDPERQKTYRTQQFSIANITLMFVFIKLNTDC